AASVATASRWNPRLDASSKRKPACMTCISSSSTPSAGPGATHGAGSSARPRCIAVAYYALLTTEAAPLVAGTDAGAARWMPARKHPPLAFDHERILTYALERLSNKLEYTTVGFQLLPKKFTLSQLQRVYE